MFASIQLCVAPLLPGQGGLDLGGSLLSFSVIRPLSLKKTKQKNTAFCASCTETFLVRGSQISNEINVQPADILTDIDVGVVIVKITKY